MRQRCRIAYHALRSRAATVPATTAPQAQQGREDLHSCHDTSVHPLTLQLKTANKQNQASGGDCQHDPGGYRREGEVDLRELRLRGGEPGGTCRSREYPAGGGQASEGQAQRGAFVAQVDSRTRFRAGVPVSEVSRGLETSAQDRNWAALCCFRLLDAQPARIHLDRGPVTRCREIVNRATLGVF
jgi:hypothetical protein